MEKTYLFVIFGLKWFDKVNGNTYSSAVIIMPNGDRVPIEYEYGYGNDYYYRSIDFIQVFCEAHNIDFKNDIIVRDLGSTYTTKKKAKEHIVY